MYFKFLLSNTILSLVRSLHSELLKVRKKKSISTYCTTLFMNSQQTLGRLDTSNPINLLLLFKAYAKILSGKTRGKMQGEITQKLMLEV